MSNHNYKDWRNRKKKEASEEEHMIHFRYTFSFDDLEISIDEKRTH